MLTSRTVGQANVTVRYMYSVHQPYSVYLLLKNDGGCFSFFCVVR